MAESAYDALIASYKTLFAHPTAPFGLVLDPSEIGHWRAGELVKLRAADQPHQWADIGVVLDDKYLLVLRDLVQLSNGARMGYIRVIGRGTLVGAQGAAVLALLNGRVLLLRHFRHATRSWHLEIPRGSGHPGSDAAGTARIELAEEAGGTVSGPLIDLGIVHSNTGLEADSVRLFYANLIAVGAPEAAEGIERFEWVTVPELESLILEEEVTDSFTIVAYTRAKLRSII